MKKPVCRAAALLCLILLLCCPARAAENAAQAGEDAPWHVLYISSYSFSWVPVPLQIAGIDRAFEDIGGVVDYEFMDTKNTVYSEGYREFYDLLKFKLGTRLPYDGVVAGDDAALNFITLYKDELFKGVPITFLAVDNEVNAQAAAADPLVTGVIERVDYAKNIEIARTLLPEADGVTLILDGKENSVGIARQLEEQAGVFDPLPVTLLDASAFTQEELCGKLAALTERDIVFVLSMGQCRDGLLPENERYRMLREYCRAPVFRITPAGVGEGVLGGYIVDFDQCGYIAGTMLRQMMEQPQAECPALCLDTPGMYLFDYNVMQQYGLDVSLLPEEAGVFYAPQSFWKTYSNQIIIGLLVMLLIGLSIASLTIRRAERKVKEKNRELTVANRAKTDFLAHMSHDLRTPMNAILSTARLLQDRTDPAEIRADVEQIEQSGKYLLDLINDSLDMSRIESGRLELHPTPISREELFRGILTTAQMLCDQKGVRLKLELPPTAHGPWAAVEVDASRVEQVFINLISNAVKFTPEGGCVTLRMETLAVTEEAVSDRCVIADTGIGMSEAFQQHLFEPFSQERRAHTDYNNGTGLGLAIVKQIVDLLGGTIQIESRENAGTRVTLELSYPRYHGPLAAAAGQADLSVLRGKRVLLCEDHPVNAQIAIRLLAKQGMTTEHAQNGQIGLDMFSRSPERYYDLVLMDIRMPVMNGLEATRAIRALPNRRDAAAVPIVAMTANAFDSDIQQSLSAGMNAHLAKPIEPGKLYEELARQIQGR